MVRQIDPGAIAQAAVAPVDPTTPPAVTNPKAWVSWSNFGPGHTGFGAYYAVVRVNVQAVYPREAEYQAALAQRKPLHTVAPTAHGDQHVVVAGEPDAGQPVSHPGAAGNRGGSMVNPAVMDGAGVVVTCIPGTQERSVQAAFERLDRGVLDPHSAPCLVVTRRSSIALLLGSYERSPSPSHLHRSRMIRQESWGQEAAVDEDCGDVRENPAHRRRMVVRGPAGDCAARRTQLHWLPGTDDAA
jgi:hypothetical protein